MGAAPARCWTEAEGRLLRVRLARPPANLVDAPMIAALEAALAAHAGERDLKCVLLDAEGRHFSFGASVEEHLPGRCAAMLAALHGLIRRLYAFPVPVLSAVRGQCLGGGLELVLATHRVFAAPQARLGQPELRLGVFAPAASALLPERIGSTAAADLLLSGRSVEADEALALGLVDHLDPDPEAAARAYFEEHLAPKSASSLRYAVHALRGAAAGRLAERLAALESLYLDGLMETRDATEGLEAFIAKREARWENA